MKKKKIESFCLVENHLFIYFCYLSFLADLLLFITYKSVASAIIETGKKKI